MPDNTSPLDRAPRGGATATAETQGAGAPGGATGARRAPAWTDDPRRVGATVRRLALPVILEQLLQGTVPLANSIIIGHLGRAELAGVGAGAQFEWLLLSAIGALAVGANVLVSHAIGAGDRDLAGRAARQALLMGLVVAGGVALVGLTLAETLLALIGSASDVIAAGAPYLRLLLSLDAGLIGMLIAGGTLRATGDTRTPAKVTAGVVVASVVLSFLLVYGVAGLPALGTAGAGLATGVARLGGAVLLIAFALQRLPGPAGGSGFAFDAALSRRILGVGLPAGGEQLLFSTSFLVFNTLLMGLGTAVFAAGWLVGNAISLSFLAGLGFSMATTVLVGQAMGAGRPDLARLATRRAATMAVVYATAAGSLLVLAAEPIAWIFTSDAEVVATAIAPMRIMGAIQPPAAFAFVIAGALRGAGDTRFVMIATGLSAWLVRLPGAILLGFVLGLGPVGAFSGSALDAIVRSAVGYLRWRSGRWEKLRV